MQFKICKFQIFSSTFMIELRIIISSLKIKLTKGLNFFLERTIVHRYIRCKITSISVPINNTKKQKNKKRDKQYEFCRQKSLATASTSLVNNNFNMFAGIHSSEFKYQFSVLLLIQKYH